MLKAILALPLLLLSAASYAAGIGPEIAYVKEGAYTEIYLVEPDGSRQRLLYRSKLRHRIFTLDMKPGGGELAFEEVASNASPNAVLKVLRYDDAGRVLSTQTRNVCRISSLDYHPSGSDLLFSDSCSGTGRLDTASGAVSPLGVPANINKVAWRSATELLYNRSTATASDIFTAPISDPANLTRIGEVRLVQLMDVSTSGNLLLVDPVDYGSLSLFDVSTGTEQKGWQIGNNGRFSPDDIYVAYTTGYDVRGRYIMLRRLDGQGAPFRLIGKTASYGVLDWRN